MRAEKNIEMGDRIKGLRGTTPQTSVIKACRITSQQMLSRYESGMIPPADILERIATYFGTTTSWLLTGSGDAPPPGENKPAPMGSVAILGALGVESLPTPIMTPLEMVIAQEVATLTHEDQLRTLDAIRVIQRGGHLDSSKE